MRGLLEHEIDTIANSRAREDCSLPTQVGNPCNTVVKLSIMVGKLVTENIFQTGESRINLVIKTPFLKKFFKNLNFNLHILGFPSILIVEKE